MASTRSSAAAASMKSTTGANDSYGWKTSTSRPRMTDQGFVAWANAGTAAGVNGGLNGGQWAGVGGRSVLGEFPVGDRLTVAAHRLLPAARRGKRQEPREYAGHLHDRVQRVGVVGLAERDREVERLVQQVRERV